jgi:DNA-binding NarL/FixJ family response regulator
VKEISVYVVDDHPIVMKGLRLVLDKEPDVTLTGEAASYKDLKLLLKEGEPDVLVLDMTLPDCDGLDVLRDMKVSHPRVPVLVLSMHPEEQLAIRCFKCGAMSYLNKMRVSEELVSAIKKLASGGRYVTSAVADLLAAGVDSSSAETLHESLSDREFQVLQLIARGMTVEEIAKVLSISHSTVRTYRERIQQKMKMRNDAELTYYAVKNNLVE